MIENDTFLADLVKWADRVHRATPGASEPPVDLWQRVLVQVKSQSKETMNMNSATTLTAPITRRTSHDEAHEGFRHYANLAATLAIVIAVALAGWFATMQLNRPGGTNSNLALIGSTPIAESTACDVEPLTVDEAMSIAKNPLAHLEPEEGFMQMDEYLLFGWIMDQESSKPGYVSPYTMVWDVQLEPVIEDDFSEATSVAQGFLDCIAHGTIGQVWRYLDPVTLHYDIHSVFPMFTSEDDARVILADVLLSPAEGIWDGGAINPTQGSGSVRINPNQELAYSVHQPPGGSVHIVDVILAPLIFFDDDGNVVLETTVTGFPIKTTGVRLNNAQNVVIGRSMIDGNWYVVGFVRAESYRLPNP